MNTVMALCNRRKETEVHRGHTKKKRMAHEEIAFAPSALSAGGLREPLRTRVPFEIL